MNDTVSLPNYSSFISPQLLNYLNQHAIDVEGIQGLKQAPDLHHQFDQLQTPDALEMIIEVYELLKSDLAHLLQHRQIDRDWIDQTTQSLVSQNQGIDYLSPEYQTILGRRNPQGRLIVGPLAKQTQTDAPPLKVNIPQWLKGPQVTLFGPPDTEKMSINAMNALHHQLPNEPPIIKELVDTSKVVPRWGADNEDSKTPLMKNLLHASQNLLGCFDQTLSFYDERKQKQYRLKSDRLSKPIKRIPGLALPDGNHLWQGQPLPLHLFDFVLHVYHNHAQPEALMFYVPKFENEDEARYFKKLIDTTCAVLQRRNPSVKMAQIGLFIVFENPRAIFRIREIADALHPYFIGGSLGWHDFLASTARLFKHDPHYRIPIKSDPNIVINHIKESHLILRNSLDPIGGIAIGGMYGTLYENGNEASFEVSIVGYIKDVITQMKRGLDGFWVAHPNFVRLGIALVEAWNRFQKGSQQGDQGQALNTLLEALVPNPYELEPLKTFVFGADVDGLDESDPLYLRGVLAADIEESGLMANHDEEEVRYNLFQALQYLVDWLCGNGCVALPALMHNAQGEPVFVRVMDDLATTERSRWEVWAEVFHGRISKETVNRILEEEITFIQSGLDLPTKRVQIHWQGEAARWYPVAIRILRQLIFSPTPVEWVAELILPFTFDVIRNADDPYQLAQSLHPLIQEI